MSFSNSSESALLALILHGTAWAGIAQNHATPITNLHLALHTADPGEAGDQTTSEAAYVNYARVAVPRSTAGFTVPTNGVSSLAADVNFPTGGSGSTGTGTHASLGTAATGTGQIIMKGPLATAITFGNNVRPQVTTASTFSVD